MRADRGFTFIEMLAAMLFMAIVIPVAVEALMLANQVGVRAQRRQVAVMLADKVLTEAMATETWRNGDQGGDFEEDWPEYRWSLTTTGWDEDTMRIVTASVFYMVQGREFEERLSTLGDELEETTIDAMATAETGS